MQTGEDLQGLRKSLDATRLFSLVLLLLHFYYCCHRAFEQWHLTAESSDKVLVTIAKTGLFGAFNRCKLIALGLLFVSLLGARGRKEERLRHRTGLVYMGVGLTLYFGSYLLFQMDVSLVTIALLYMVVTFGAFILVMTGGSKLSRVLRRSLVQLDGHKREGSGFLQEERCIRTEYSINLPATYNYRGKSRKSWINFIDGRRGVLIVGSPGAGKSWFIIENMIRQFVERGFALFVFDFKYDALTKLVYNQFLKHRQKYPDSARFYCINFTDLRYSHRCNVIEPGSMLWLGDAIGASQTILLSMNRTWAGKQGDFFVESPVNFLAALIWFLRKYQDGKYCTLPHAIELAQTPYDKLFTILAAEPEIATLIDVFIIAYRNKTMEMLDGQISSAKIPLGRLASPELYYILTGNDLSLDVNNPEAPKILCLGGSPKRQAALGPVLSLYIDRVNKIINEEGKYRCAMICDEFATVRSTAVLGTISTGRSNNIVPVIAVQDLSQLRTQYSHAEADQILNIAGNFICGQIGGETAKWISERIPSSMQYKRTIATNSSDTTLSKSGQMGNSITPATLANLSSGEFVGVVADNPGMELELKAFHAKIVNDVKELEKERKTLRPLPVVREVDENAIKENYFDVKKEVQGIIDDEMSRIMNDPMLARCLVGR